MANIARLEKVPLRQLWVHEANDFTVWLADNLDFVGDAIGMELNLVEREAAAGPFSADILAEDAFGNNVIIENQLERTDHDHLGKVITYFSNLEAKTAVWITKQVRPEHETAVQWLNEMSPADTAFFLIRIEAFKISDSPPAPLLTVVVGTTPEVKEVGLQKKEKAERHILRYEFWEQILEKALEKTPLHANSSPGTGSWLSASVGDGIYFSYIIRMHDAQVRFYLESSNTQKNKKRFDQLFVRKDEIEETFGEPLTWLRHDEFISSRIDYDVIDLGLRDKDKWELVQDQMINAMLRLYQAFEPEIKRLRN